MIVCSFRGPKSDGDARFFPDGHLNFLKFTGAHPQFNQINLPRPVLQSNLILRNKETYNIADLSIVLTPAL
jgi:hypothetical protein